MKRITKLLCCLLSLVILCCLLTGCGQKNDDARKSVLPDNAIISMVPYDTEKPVVVIGMRDNTDGALMKEVLDKQFPDLSIVVRHVASNSQLEIECNLSDILFAQEFSMTAEVENRLLDLSSLECTADYFASSLQSCVSANSGNQYMLPCPANVTGIIYNKTLFAENGWEVPHSKSEFMALCKTIEESGVVERAFASSFRYAVAELIFAEMFNRHDLFSTLNYYTWQEEYAKAGSEASIDAILRPMIDVFREFLDAGIIRMSDFTMMPADRSAALYKTRTLAMSTETQRVQIIAENAGSTDEFGMFPFYSGDTEDSGYLQTSPMSYICVNKRVADDPEKLENVKRIISFLSSKEGLAAYVPEGDFIIPQIKSADVNYSDSSVLAECQKTLEAGNYSPISDYMKGFLSQSQNAFDVVLNAMLQTSRHDNPLGDGLMTYEQAVSYIDDLHHSLINNGKFEVETLYATVTEPFTILETSLYIAQMFKDKTGADIGLCLNTSNTRGNFNAFPVGDIVKTTVDSVPYRNMVAELDTFYRGAKKYEDDMKLVTLSMTGAQIKEAIEYPGQSQGGVYPSNFVAAGLKLEFAPWAELGSRFQSVKLADGSDLDPDKLYTVAAWSNTVVDKYITETLEVYEDKYQDLLIEQLTKDKAIAPFKDGRFVLNWDVRAGETKE